MPLSLRSEMPGLEGASGWVNGELYKEDLKGKPVLIHFWAVSCRMCKRLLPTINAWRNTYGEAYGLQVVGVHTVRSAVDTETDLIMETIAEYGLIHPIMIDRHHHIADSFQNDMVPAMYLFDRRQQMRHFQAGERGLKLAEQCLHKILGVKP